MAVRDRTLALLTRPEHTAQENLAAAEAFARAAQRLLDGHRLAALAAGNVPQRGTDACAGCLKPAALAAAFASPSRSIRSGRSCSGAWLRCRSARRPG